MDTRLETTDMLPIRMQTMRGLAITCSITLGTVACASHDAAPAARSAGSDEAPRPSVSSPQAPSVDAGASASTRSPVVVIASATGDGEQAAAVATAYLAAVVKHDWPAACATRLGSERADLARLAGGCEIALAGVFEHQPIQLLANVNVGQVRRRGDVIAIDFHQPGQTAAAITLLLRPEAGIWKLVDLPDDQSF